MFNEIRYRLYLLKHALNEMAAAASEASDEIGRFVKAVDELKNRKNIPRGGKSKGIIGAKNRSGCV